MKVSRPGLYSYGIEALRKALALLTMTGSGLKAVTVLGVLVVLVSVVVVEAAVVALGVVVEGAIKYEIQPRSSKASRTSDAQAR